MATDNHLPAAEAGVELIGDRVRIFQRGRTWYANFQHNRKQHRLSLKTTNKKEARRHALRIAADLDAARWAPNPAIATVEQAIAAYLDYLRAEDRAAKTLVKYTRVFERVKELALERNIKDLSGIDLKFMDAYRRLRSDEGAQAKTRYTESVVIRQLVNFAVTRDLLVTDPLKGLKLKKPKPTTQPCWTHAEKEQILDASPDVIRPALTLLAETGMRFGELAWLTWDDVDSEANVLRIQAKQGWKPKTGDQRAVPISLAAQRVLAALPRRWSWVVTMPPSRRHPQAGRQWSERRLLATLKRVLKKVGLPGKLHTFRHSFISNALLKGTPPAVVREWVGQVDRAIIDLYTHVHNEASQSAMQRLAEANQKPLQSGGTKDGSQQRAGSGPAQN